MFNNKKGVKFENLPFLFYILLSFNVILNLNSFIMIDETFLIAMLFGLATLIIFFLIKKIYLNFIIQFLKTIINQFKIKKIILLKYQYYCYKNIFFYHKILLNLIYPLYLNSFKLLIIKKTNILKNCLLKITFIKIFFKNILNTFFLLEKKIKLAIKTF